MTTHIDWNNVFVSTVFEHMPSDETYILQSFTGSASGGGETLCTDISGLSPNANNLRERWRFAAASPIAMGLQEC